MSGIPSGLRFPFLPPVYPLGSQLQALDEACALGSPAVDGHIAGAGGVLQPHSKRIHFKLMGRFVHERLQWKSSLGVAEAPVGSRGGLIGIDQQALVVEVSLPIEVVRAAGHGVE